MPFPWKKKSRASRISQIVADLQSPNRGGSLVVETGFPTSLVDLFVKHRDRSKKPSNKKKSKTKRSNHEISDSVPRSNPPPEMNPSGYVIDCTSCSALEPEDLEIVEKVEIVGDRGCESEGRRTETSGVADAAVGVSAVCVVALKMFVVAVLALSTKKLVLGITLSASLLLLLEFAGKHVVQFMKPCANGEAVLKYLVVRLFRFLQIRNDDYTGIGKNCGRESVLMASLARKDELLNELIGGTPELSSSTGEIQLVEPNSDHSESNGIETETLMHQVKKKKTIAEETMVMDGDGAEVRVSENRPGTRGKLNGKIFKKLVCKKLSRPTMEKSGGDELETKNQEQEQGKEAATDSGGREVKNMEILELDQESGTSEVGESCGSGIQSNEILIVIVLVGLIGGRIPAMILTVTGCFTLRLLQLSRTMSLNRLPLKG